MLLLARLVGERTLTEAFSEGIRGYPLEALSLPPEGMEAFLLQPRPTIRLQVEMSVPIAAGSTKNPSILSYQIAVGIDPQSGRLSVLDEQLEDLHRNRRPRSKNPCLEKVSRERDGETVELLAIRKHGSQRPPCEEAIGLHHTIVTIRSRGEWLVPCLHCFSHQHPQAFVAIRRVIATALSGITDLRTELDEKRGVLNLNILPHDTWMPVRVVSEGTLPLLALCAVAMAEPPVN